MYEIDRNIINDNWIIYNPRRSIPLIETWNLLSFAMSVRNEFADACDSTNCITKSFQKSFVPLSFRTNDRTSVCHLRTERSNRVAKQRNRETSKLRLSSISSNVQNNLTRSSILGRMVRERSSITLGNSIIAPLSEQNDQSNQASITLSRRHDCAILIINLSHGGLIARSGRASVQRTSLTETDRLHTVFAPSTKIRIAHWDISVRPIWKITRVPVHVWGQGPVAGSDPRPGHRVDIPEIAPIVYGHCRAQVRGPSDSSGSLPSAVTFHTSVTHRREILGIQSRIRVTRGKSPVPTLSSRGSLLPTSGLEAQARPFVRHRHRHRHRHRIGEKSV